MEIPKEVYKTRIQELEIGNLKVGKENTLPFYLFEGEMPNPPMIALEVLDEAPNDWHEVAREPYKDVLSSPLLWAKKAIGYGADMICLKLISTDPLGSNRSGEEGGKIAKHILDNIDVPLIVLGCGNIEKDSIVLKEVASFCSGGKILLGGVTDGNYKSIGASCLAYKHNVSAQTPIDVNLAKQLNILLGNLGLPPNQIMIDPSGSALGYGLEYTYSIIERIRQASLVSGDEKLSMPIFVEIGKEVWKIKELRENNPEWGDIKKRGILWEAITGLSFILAGCDVLVIRHPSSMKLLKEIIGELMGDGGVKIKIDKVKEEIKKVEEKETRVYIVKEEVETEEIKRHPGYDYKPSWIDMIDEF